MPDLSLPAGFRAAGIHCGIKPNPARRDLSLFVSDRPAAVAGVFTTNRVVGAPVIVCRERVPGDSARAVLINSGNANACTGRRGLDDARASTRLVADRLGCDESAVLVCSTGVIGRHLPMETLSAGIPKAVSALDASADAFEAAARGMMTTDTVPKRSARRVEIAGKTVTVAGAAKGAAMIAPNMATMLAVVMTDAVLTPAAADTILRTAVDHSFNRISVDGHTSTSDTVLLLANGAAGVDASTGPAAETLARAVAEVCGDLARAIIRDAEGATHDITIDVRGLPTEADAVQVARAVADSPLVKTAVAGADPNWGRVVSAAGYSGVLFEETDLSLTINGTLVYKAGIPQPFDAKALSASIRDNRDTSLALTFTLGDAAAQILTSDLTAEYVRLNADYTT
jgi:glutamate N-acetyltransferase/amino-acid N-acetyltransferase